MIKRIFFLSLILLIIAGALAGFGLYEYRQNLRQQRLAAKAPEKQITIIEGWGVNDIADYLGNKNILPAKDFITAQENFDANGYPLLASKPRTAGLEGFLFPDTYMVAVYPGSSTTTIADLAIKKMLGNFAAKFTPQMEDAAGSRNMTVYQIVTLASIIEKETGRNALTAEQKQALDSERKIIAGIFYNRLNVGMPLESDATINFVTGKNTPQASTADTAVNSPYNTYKYKGLPPGPICNPSLSSLMAAVYPAQTDYFYFLHKQPSGEPIYSKTYEEHLANKQKYLK